MSATGFRSSALIERETELAAIREALARATAGTGSLVVLDGAPGVGKTRVLDAASDEARAQGHHVLAARGAEAEVDFVLGIMRQLFERPVKAMGADRRLALVEEAAGLAIEALAPSATAVRAEPTHGLLHGFYWLTVELAADAPVTVLVDDAHWGDTASLRALAYIARRLRTLPVTLLVTTRTDSPSRGSALSALVASADVRIPLSSLSLEGTRVLVSSLSGEAVDEGAATACHAATGGNPFLVSELVRAVRAASGELTREVVARVASDVPRPLSQSIMLRFEALSDDALRVAQTIAVLGDAALPHQVATLTGLSPEATTIACAELKETDVLTDGEPLVFSHPLLRSAVYASLAEGVRGTVSRRAAELLQAEGAANDRVAALLTASTPAGVAETVELLAAAASDASRRGAFDVAARLLDRAVREPPEAGRVGEVLLALGKAELASDQRESAVDHLRAALKAGLTAEDRVTAALALTQRGGIENPVQLLDEIAVGLDGDLLLRVDVVRNSTARYVPQHSSQALERMRGYSSLRGATPAERLALATAAAARSAESAASAAGTAQMASLALGDDRLICEQTGDAHALSLACHALLSCEEFDAVQRQVDLLMADARARGSRYAFFAASCAGSSRAWLTGDLAGAVAHSEAGLHAAEEMPASPITSAGASFLVLNAALALIERGELDAAERMVGTLRDADTNPVSRMHVDLARAYLSLARNDADDSLGLFIAASDQATKAGSEQRQIRWRLGAALATAGLGRTDEAIAYADEQVQLDTIWGAPGGLGAAMRTRAIVGDPAELPDRLRAAVAMLRQSARKLELAHSLVDLGVALRKSGRRVDCVAALSEGLDLAAACGAVRRVEQARSELLIAGARPRRDRVTGRDSLTPSERRIAHMAAGGATNRAIAQQLFLAPKTVELHLTSVYRKLGIAGRADLSAALESPSE